MEFVNYTGRGSVNSSMDRCGGAVCFQYTYSSGGFTLTVTNCPFRSCSAGVDRGGMFCSHAGQFVMTGCSFSQCTAGLSGGGVFLSSTSSCASVSDCTFTSCTSSWGAGAWIEKCSTTGSVCTRNASYGMVPLPSLLIFTCPILHSCL